MFGERALFGLRRLLHRGDTYLQNVCVADNSVSCKFTRLFPPVSRGHGLLVKGLALLNAACAHGIALPVGAAIWCLTPIENLGNAAWRQVRISVISPAFQRFSWC